MKTARNTKLFVLAGMIVAALLLSACVSSAPFQVPAPLRPAGDRRRSRCGRPCRHRR